MTNTLNNESDQNLIYVYETAQLHPIPRDAEVGEYESASIKPAWKTVGDCELAYLRTMRQGIQQYASIIEAFPAFWRTFLRIRIDFARDGIVVTYWPHDQEKDRIQFFEHDMSRHQLLHNGEFFPPGVGSDAESSGGGGIVSCEAYEVSGQTEAGEWITMTSPWYLMRIYTAPDPSLWSVFVASGAANHSVLQHVAAHFMKVEQRQVLHTLETLIQKFRTLLDSEPGEEAVQQFLNTNTILLAPTAARVFIKHKLGAEYVTDYVIEHAERQYTLVEIERPGLPLFGKRGDPSNQLGHAQRQVEDWLEWVHEHIEYARTTLPHINEPKGLVIIGRRSTMDARSQKALQRKNAELKNIQILTYDDVLDAAQRHLNNLRDVGKPGVGDLEP